MNLVVIARRPEIGERCAAIISQLIGRHPSRTIICSSVDPDGPGSLDARVTAHCMLPREDAPETCAETIYILAGGDTGRHLAAIVEPLLIHDLPVSIWWPGEPPLGSEPATDLLECADRLFVDGSGWSGDGLARLGELAAIVAARRLAVIDFALARQARWREAIASTFDHPDFLPFLRSIRRVSVTYATHDELGRPGTTNLVKPLYHVAWLASRLELTVAKPLTALGPGPASRVASRSGRRRGGPAPPAWPVGATRPACATVMATEARSPCGPADRQRDAGGDHPPGRAAGRASGLGAAGGRDRRGRRGHRPGLAGRRAPARSGLPAPRRTETDLLAEAIELAGRDRVSDGAIVMAADLAGVRCHAHG